MPQPPQPAAGGAASAAGASEQLEWQRAECLTQAVRGLGERSKASRERLKAILAKWNDALAAPAAAEELVQVLDAPRELENYRARIKSWQAHCKQEAWLRWYAVKHEWLSKDLAIMREHTEALVQERATQLENIRQAEATFRSIQRQKRHLEHKAGIKRQERLFRDLVSSQVTSAKEDQQLMQRKLPEAEAARDKEQQEKAELTIKVEEARRALEQDQASEREARRKYLEQRARRVALEMQRLARTCVVTRATATALDLTLRGGVRASVQKAAAGGAGLVRIIFRPPTADSSQTVVPDPTANLGRELYELAWRRLVASVDVHEEPGPPPPPQPHEALQAVVACREVPGLVRRMDSAVLRVTDQLQALRDLPKECPEVMHVNVELLDQEVLAVTVALLVVRSHEVFGGQHGVVPTASPAFGAALGEQGEDPAFRVDAAKVGLELEGKLATFPEAMDWSSASAQQVLGNGGEAAAAESALRGGQRNAAPAAGSLSDAVAVAARAMRSASSAASVALVAA